MDFIFFGLIIAAFTLFGKMFLHFYVFKRVYGTNVNKFLKDKVLEKRVSINRSKEKPEKA